MANDRGGVRPPQYITDMALARVEDLMVQALPWPTIVAILIDEGMTESEGTAVKWRAEIWRRWREEDQAMRPVYKNLWRARLNHQYRRILERADSERMSPQAYAMLQAEATRIAKVAIVLDGLATPAALRNDGMPDVSSMSPLEREREIAKLLAQREAAMAQTGGGN